MVDDTRHRMSFQVVEDLLQETADMRAVVAHGGKGETGGLPDVHVLDLGGAHVELGSEPVEDRLDDGQQSEISRAENLDQGLFRGVFQLHCRRIVSRDTEAFAHLRVDSLSGARLTLDSVLQSLRLVLRRLYLRFLLKRLDL